VEFHGLQKSRFIVDVFKNIEQEEQIEVSSKLRGALMNIVAIKWTQAAYVFLQSQLVEFESSDRKAVVILNVPLQQPIAASDLRDVSGGSDCGVGQPLHYYKTTPDPKVAWRREVEPPISHVYWGGARQIFDRAARSGLPRFCRVRFPAQQQAIPFFSVQTKRSSIQDRLSYRRAHVAVDELSSF